MKTTSSDPASRGPEDEGHGDHEDGLGPSSRLESHLRILLAITATASTFAAGMLLWLVLGTGPGDRASRERALARMVSESSGIYDSHTDPDVGRLLQPGLQDRPGEGTLVSSNALGLRERDFEIPKAPGTVRIVLLGDSFVFGHGVDAGARLGIHLERLLSEQARGGDRAIECLHVGITGWDIPSAAAFLRRQLTLFDPDLVLHISVPNDIEGNVGVRGFGARSRFYPRHRDRADSLIRQNHVVQELGLDRPGYLRLGLDHESRRRYSDALASIEELRGVLEAGATPYRLILNYRHFIPVARHFLGRHLPPASLVYLTREFGSDRTLWNGQNDPHWNEAGHRRVAEILYGLIQRDGLLPDLQLAPRAEAMAALHANTESSSPSLDRYSARSVLAAFGLPEPAASIDFARLGSPNGRQIHGGVDRRRRASPLAAFMLANKGEHLRLELTTLDRAELHGMKLQVFLDEVPVGTRSLPVGTDVELAFDIPEALRTRDYLSVRLRSDDYVYAEDDPQHCVSFYLRRAEILEKSADQ